MPQDLRAQSAVIQLQKVVLQLDSDEHILLLGDLKPGALFTFKGRRFKKARKAKNKGAGRRGWVKKQYTIPLVAQVDTSRIRRIPLANSTFAQNKGIVAKDIFSTDYKLGILGGGQLGKMMLYSTRKFDIRTKVLDSSPEAPAQYGANNFK